MALVRGTVANVLFAVSLARAAKPGTEKPLKELSGGGGVRRIIVYGGPASSSKCLIFKA